ncbi:MAG: SpoIIE family protein phosphatase, partial [Myxococcota bacterium]
EALATGPIEAISDPDDTLLTVVGGRQTKGALPMVTRHFDAAVYSSRGRGYAAYNEDGAGVYCDEKGFVYAGVFDQAGGLGGSVRGAASGLAAKTAFHAFREIATAPQTKDIRAALTHAIDDAHKTLVDRGEGEVTTAVLAVLQPKRVILVSSGDSAAMRFDEKGQLLGVTDKHEAISAFGVGCLVHAVGLVPEGPAPDVYEWPLKTGHWLLMGSDGLLDAGLDIETVGKKLARATSAEDAVNQLAKVVLRRMTLLQAKPDNLTIIAIRARPASP